MNSHFYNNVDQQLTRSTNQTSQMATNLILYVIFILLTVVSGEQYDKHDINQYNTKNCSHGVFNNLTNDCKCDQNWGNRECNQILCCTELYPRFKIFAISLFFGWTGISYFIIKATPQAILLLVISIISFMGCCRLIFEKNPFADNCCHIQLICIYVSIVWWFLICLLIAKSIATFDNTYIGTW